MSTLGSNFNCHSTPDESPGKEMLTWSLQYVPPVYEIKNIHILVCKILNIARVPQVAYMKNKS